MSRGLGEQKCRASAASKSRIKVAGNACGKKSASRVKAIHLYVSGCVPQS